MIPSMLAANLGMAPAPAAPKKHKGKAGGHLKAASAAHKAGDHATAKKHALAAVNALHRMQRAAPAADADADDPAAGAAPAAAC